MVQNSWQAEISNWDTIKTRIARIINCIEKGLVETRPFKNYNTERN